MSADTTLVSSSTPAPPPLGTLIGDGTSAGALQLAAVLGYGGYGVVYRGISPSGNLYAVKCLLRTSNPNNPKQAYRQRRLHMRQIAFHRLAGAGAHPGIVRLHRVIEPPFPAEDGTLCLPSPYLFLVMDYGPCGDLFTLILHKRVYLGRTSLVGSVFAQLASALSHCHSLGIFHRDLKPENVLCWDGGATVRLADFGLATTERRSREWRMGNVKYMSPECLNGNASSSPYSPFASDIWSLAILLLNLLTARNPWTRASLNDPSFSAYLASPRNFLPQVLPISSGLNDVLVRALDVRWERREAFGVDGLADGVARLVADFEVLESRSRRSFGSIGKQRSGMYAPDVVFEGEMARCPWEVGMHIPSGSSDSEASNQIPMPQEPVEEPVPESPIVKKCSRSSSASYENSAAESPSPSFMVEDSDCPCSITAKEEASVEVQSVSYRKRSSSESSTQLTSRWSVKSSIDSHDSLVRFANPSDAEGPGSSSSSAACMSPSGRSSTGSEYSATRSPGTPPIAPESRVCSADLTLAKEAEGNAHSSAAPFKASHGHGRNRSGWPVFSRLASLIHRDGAAQHSKLQPRRSRTELCVNADLDAAVSATVEELQEHKAPLRRRDASDVGSSKLHSPRAGRAVDSVVISDTFLVDARPQHQQQTFSSPIESRQGSGAVGRYFQLRSRATGFVPSPFSKAVSATADTEARDPNAQDARASVYASKDGEHICQQEPTKPGSGNHLPRPGDQSNILQDTLAKLAHLDLTGHINYNCCIMEANGGYCDVFIGHTYIQNNGSEAIRTVKVAIKRLRVHLLTHENFAKILAKELYIWSKLNHRNILPLLGYVLEGGYPLIVSEWMDNGTIRRYLKVNPQLRFGPVGPVQIIGIANGIKYLHTNDIIHSDIKADNILVDRSGEALLCDFGISRMLHSSLPLPSTSTGNPKGSTRWFAIELLDECSRHTKETDIWAFGMTVYEILTKELPFNVIKVDIQVALAIMNGNLPSRPSVLPNHLEAVWDLCEKCWISPPETRISIEQVIGTLGMMT